MEKVKFLNQTDFGEVLEQDYEANNEYANAMILLNYLSSFDNGTILKIDVNDNRFTDKIAMFLEKYIFRNIYFHSDPFNINTFNMMYGIPLFIRFITSITNIDLSKTLIEGHLNDYKLTDTRAYEYLVINEIYKRHGVDRSITQMDIINFGLNEIMTLDKLTKTGISRHDQMLNTLVCTFMAIMYYIKYREEYDSILNYFAEFIIKNNYQKIFEYNYRESYININYLKNILVLDFNYSEYQADKYIEEFYNKCTSKIKE